MAVFGIFGKHAVDACPWNNIETAKILIGLVGGYGLRSPSKVDCGRIQRKRR